MTHLFLFLFENMLGDTLRWETLFSFKNVIAEEKLVNLFAIGKIRVLFNRELFTKPGFQIW
jgi:hypothetical protein